MARNLAMVIGINKYRDRSLQSLKYAQRDAELISDFLRNQAKFAEVCLFSHDSPDFQSYSTHPHRSALRKFLRERFEYRFLDPQDQFWFFFSGHGIRYQNRDYLIPEDGDPADPEETAIALNWVTERLSRSGSENIVLILDACRNEGLLGQKGGAKFGNEPQKGILTFYACKPLESSWEIDEPIYQGSFTFTLLQSLKSQTLGAYLTLEQMEQYLQQNVPALNRQYGKPWQTPHIEINSASIASQPLLPGYSTKANIDELIQTDSTPSVSPNHLPPSQPRAAETVESPTTLPPTPSRVAKQDDLSSEKGIDYTQLRDFLEAGKWKEADKETLVVMCQATGRSQEGWLRPDDLSEFPCTDLRTLDRLWRKYSKGRFGFRVQNEIYLSSRPNTYGGWSHFGARVGWRVQKKWLWYHNLRFDTSARKGHLPAAWLCGCLTIYTSEWGRPEHWGREKQTSSPFASLSERLERCGIKRASLEHPSTAVVISSSGKELPPASASLTVRTQHSPTSKPDTSKFWFEYAEVELKSVGMLGFAKKPEIKPQRKAASSFIEDLGSGVELEMVAIPRGIFVMGASDGEQASPSELPQHQVSVAPFFMGKSPITQLQWNAVVYLPQIDRPLVANPSKFDGDRHPVEQVSWDEAIEFCKRLSLKTGRHYRLPSEAEWEYACRAGTLTPFHCGNVLTSDLANYDASQNTGLLKGRFRNQTNPVDTFNYANRFGLYDMHGNVWEWCLDHWHNSYTGAPSDGTARLKSKDDQYRVIRGGSWAGLQGNCRSASRKGVPKEKQERFIGFRVVCS